MPLDGHSQSASASAVLLFKRILDFKKQGEEIEKRGDKRYPTGSRSLLKSKLTLPARDDEGLLLPPSKQAPMDWGGQLVNVSNHGASIRIHPAALAVPRDKCCLKIEFDNMIFELDATIAHFRVNPQHANCGLILNFADAYARKAYLQLIEPVVIGSTLEVVMGKVLQDIPGYIRQELKGESGAELKIWRDEAERIPKHFELLVHGYCVRGSTDAPGLRIGYRDAAKSDPRGSRPAFPASMSGGHQGEVRRFFQFIVQNLGKGVPSDIRRFLEMAAV